MQERRRAPQGALTVAETQRLHFDEVARRGALRRDRLFVRRMAIVERMVRSIPPGVLLDIGCSDGAITEMLVPHELFGIDVSPESVERALARGIDARVGSIEEDLPFGDEDFDVVFAGEVIEHTIRTDFLLSECNRVLASGGHLIVTSPNVNSVASRLTMSLLDLPPVGAARYRSPHVRDFTVRVLRYALAQNGFKTLEVRGTWLGIPLPKAIARLAGAIDSMIAYRAPRLAAGVVVLATKVRRAQYRPENNVQEFLKI